MYHTFAEKSISGAGQSREKTQRKYKKQIPEEKPRVLGGEATNYHMLDVTFWKKKISFAMFHGLCDGLGLNRFIEAVLYHYFCLRDGKTYSDEGIWTEKTPYDPAERADPFAVKTKVDTKELKKLAGGEKRNSRSCPPWQSRRSDFAGSFIRASDNNRMQKDNRNGRVATGRGKRV